MFEVEEGPQTLIEDIKVSGNAHIGASDMAAPKTFELRAGQPFSPRKLANDRNRISATYLDRGYLNVEVKMTVTPSRKILIG